MGYRLLCRLFAIIDLIGSSLGVSMCILLGIIFTNEFKSANYKVIFVVVAWLIASVGIILNWISLVADIRLFEATKKDRDLASAIGLCQLWLMVTWIVFILGCLLTMGLLLHYVYVSYADSKTNVSHHGFSSAVIFLILRGSSLYCVHGYVRSLKKTLAMIVSESLIPLAPFGEPGTPSNDYDEFPKNYVGKMV